MIQVLDRLLEGAQCFIEWIIIVIIGMNNCHCNTVQKWQHSWVVLAHIFNPSTWKAEAGGSPLV